MDERILMLIQVFFPVLAGCLLFVTKLGKYKKIRNTVVVAVLAMGAAMAILGCFGKTTSVELLSVTPTLRLVLCNDGLSKLFCTLVSFVWLVVGVYSFRYFKGTDNKVNFYGFYVIALGVLQGVGLAGNLVSFYLFYEWMTLMTVPLVFHIRSTSAVRASRKYLFYSVAGASMALAGIFLLAGNGVDLSFTATGLAADVNKGQVLVAALLLILGFGTKAGMFPMHGWLPTAHPVAPAPASAVLSGVITKAGVLGIIRSVYCVIGIEFLAGTYVQILFLCLSLLTVFMGSMLAYKEKVLKKRLAYSTVSQVSYVVFGLALRTPAGLVAGLLHMVFHSVIKNGLFLFAGMVIHETGEERVEELKGLGRQMPITFWCFTIASLALVGIPPTSGFVSKWYLATEALKAPVGAFSYVGPAILLVSALLTAGYLLSITADGFFPGRSFVEQEPKVKELFWSMLIPMLVFAVASVVLGMCSEPLVTWVTEAVTKLLGY